MNGYRVSFYKDLLNSTGHSFKCLQRQIDVESDDPSQALVLAEQQIGNKRLNIDCVEVVNLADDPHIAVSSLRRYGLCNHGYEGRTHRSDGRGRYAIGRGALVLVEIRYHRRDHPRVVGGGLVVVARTNDHGRPGYARCSGGNRLCNGSSRAGDLVTFDTPCPWPHCRALQV